MKKNIKFFALIGMLIIAISVFMVFKGYPMIAVSKAEKALYNGDGEALSEVYESHYGILTDSASDSVQDYMEEWIKPVANDFNQKFSNFESQEKMDLYLKNEYGTIFFKNANSTEYIVRNPFGKLNGLRSSKIKCLEIKELFDETEKEINNIEDRMSNLFKLSDIPKGNAVLSERHEESFMISLDILTLKHKVEDATYLRICSSNDTMYIKLKERQSQILSKLEELENELDNIS